MAKENRESRWHVVRRCLAMIRRLQRGPASGQELMQAVQAEIQEAYDPARRSPLKKQFDNDKLHLVDDLGLGLKYDRQTNHYTLHENVYPLLDLPGEDLTTIAWLRQTFEAEAPQHQAVETFLSRLISFLAPERRAEIELQRLSFKLDLVRRDGNHVPAEVKAGIARSLALLRRVEFDYLSSENESGSPIRHIIDPYEYFFDNGHYYLKGWCHYVRQGDWQRPIESYNAYRLDGMSNFQLLPHKISWPPPRARKHRLRYQLNAQVVRRGVSRQRWIDFTDPDDLEWQPDGSVIINGVTDNDFFAAQALLRYGDRCQILNEGPVQQFIIETVKKMAKNYGIAPS